MLLTALGRRWLLALTASVLGAAAAAAGACCVVEAPYRAEARLTVLSTEGAGQVRDTILSPQVMNPVVAQLLDTEVGAGKDPARLHKELRDRIKVDLPPSHSYILRVSMSGDNAEQAAARVNLVARTCVEVTKEAETKRGQVRLNRLKEVNLKLKQMIDDLRDRLPKMPLGLRKDSLKRLLDNAQDNWRSWQDDLEFVRKQRIKGERIPAHVEERLKSEVERWKEKVSKIEEDRGQLWAMDRESKEVEAQIAPLVDGVKNTSKEIVSLWTQVLSQAVFLHQEADVPDTRDRKKQLQVAILSALAAFALILLGIALGEVRARRIYTAAETAQELGLNLLGVVPALPEPLCQPLALLDAARAPEWRNALHGHVDAVRTMLRHITRQRSLGVLMITSALRGEGKTSLACHLAASLARTGHKTLLIDGDLRSPALHQRFYQRGWPGLAEYLRHEVHLVQTVRKTPLRKLWLLPAGTWDSQTAQAFVQADLRGIFNRLKKHFDFLVVDSGPVLPAAEALLLGQQVEAVLFSVLCKVSRIPPVRAACQRLEQLGVTVLGAVAQGVRGNDSGTL
jgi:capsular exopolysaccharide synthesis family protein